MADSTGDTATPTPGNDSKPFGCSAVPACSGRHPPHGPPSPAVHACHHSRSSHAQHPRTGDSPACGEHGDSRARPTSQAAPCCRNEVNVTARRERARVQRQQQQQLQQTAPTMSTPITAAASRLSPPACPSCCCPPAWAQTHL